MIEGSPNIYGNSTTFFDPINTKGKPSIQSRIFTTKYSLFKMYESLLLTGKIIRTAIAADSAVSPASYQRH